MALRDRLPDGVKQWLRLMRLRHGPAWTVQQQRRADAQRERLEQQRDQARASLAAERARAAELQRRLRFPEEAWREQRTNLAGSAPTPARSLWYYPGDTGNPFMRVLYSRLPEVDVDPRGLYRFEDIDELGPGDTFHLHWTLIAQVGAKSREEAEAQTADVLGRIEAFVERGGTFLWSVHEEFPHECRFPDIEVGFRQSLVELASGVHLLHKSTIEASKPHFMIDPSKAFVVEHPLYRGFYADYTTRESARRQLGLADEDVMLLAFGAQRPYKGFDRLVHITPRLRADTGLEIRTMLAGPRLRSVDNAELRAAAEGVEGVTITDTAVADEAVQVLFRAADVTVLPYRDGLNSGVLMLSLSFDTRAVVPETPATADAVESGLVHLFDRASDEDLYRATLEAINRRHDRPALAESFSSRYEPAQLAGHFARQVAAILRRG